MQHKSNIITRQFHSTVQHSRKLLGHDRLLAGLLQEAELWLGSRLVDVRCHWNWKRKELVNDLLITIFLESF